MVSLTKMVRFVSSLIPIAALAALGMARFANAAGPVAINVKTAATTPLPLGFSGLNAPQMRNGVEYWDNGFLEQSKALKPGWLRTPAGTASMDFDWSAGHVNPMWMDDLISGSSPLVPAGTATILTSAAQLTQAKGGIYLSDYAKFAKALKAKTVICVNGYTDNHANSTGNYATTAQSLGLNVLEWEFSNEPYLYPAIFASAQDYATAMQDPYYEQLEAATPNAAGALFYQGLFSGGRTAAWDDAMEAVTPRYWNAVSTHVYPIQTLQSAADDIKTLNGILAHGTNEYISSYLVPKTGAGTPLYITEFNCCKLENDKFLTYIYNGIFLAEYTMRMALAPNMKGVAVNSLYTDNYDNHGLIHSVDDFESYLFAQLAANPDYSTDTASNPNTQFQFYMSAPGLAMELADTAINASTAMYPTTVTGGPKVAISGYDGKPIPAIYAQGYKGPAGKHYLLITNKSGTAESVKLKANGHALTGSVSLEYISSATAGAANSATAQNVTIQTATSANPISVGPYSVTLASW